MSANNMNTKRNLTLALFAGFLAGGVLLLFPGAHVAKADFITITYVDGSGNTQTVVPTSGVYDIPNSVTTFSVSGQATGEPVSVFCSMDQSVSKSFNEDVQGPDFGRFAIDEATQDNTQVGGPLVGTVPTWSYVQDSPGNCNGSAQDQPAVIGLPYIVNYSFSVNVAALTQNVNHVLNIGFYSSEGGAAGGCSRFGDCIPLASAGNEVTFAIVPPAPPPPPPPPPPPSAGTINVSSVNFQTGDALNSSWSVTGPANYSSNNVSAATYTNAPVSAIGIPYVNTPVANSAGTLYSLRGVLNKNVALEETNPKISGLISMLNWLVPNAEADEVCGAVNPTGPVVPTYGVTTPCAPIPGGLPLINNGDVADFVILWDPIAIMTVTPTLPITTTSPSGPVAINNTGSPGSMITNVTDTITPASANSWLTVSNLPAGAINEGTPVDVTVTANTSTAPASCATTPCVVTITFQGVSGPGSSGTFPSGSVTVTYTGSAPSGPPTPPAITINSPTPVAKCVPAQVTCSGGDGTYTWTPVDGSPTITGAGSTVQVNYCSATGTFTLDCTSAGVTTSTQIQVVPDCTLSASPNTIVPPAQTILSWSCVPGTAVPNSCSITNETSGMGIGSGLSTSSTLPVAPTANATYLLSCEANNGILPATQIPPVEVNVTVQGPGVKECNPGAPGTPNCPQ